MVAVQGSSVVTNKHSSNIKIKNKQGRTAVKFKAVKAYQEDKRIIQIQFKKQRPRGMSHQGAGDR